MGAVPEPLDDAVQPVALPSEPVPFAVVGYGWRAQFFLRLAALLPERLAVCGVVVRRPEVAARAAATWGVPTYPTLDDLLAARRPGFAVTSVPWDANPGLVRDLVGRRVPVLTETPPAPDLAGLAALWADVGASGLVQVAEQYHLMPGHAARRAAVATGTVGTPSQVQVCSTHGYHAVSLVRTLLGIGRLPATVTGTTLHGPLVDPVGRDGWTDDPTPRRAANVVATLDFGDVSGVYDFSDNQWHNPLRGRRVVVRGSHGEIDTDDVTRLAGPRTVVRSRLERRQVGYDLDLDGYDTDHVSLDGRVLWRNPFAGLRLADEEIAIASMLVATAAWTREEGPEPYPLRDGCHDHALSLAIDEAVAGGRPVRVEDVPWA